MKITVRTRMSTRPMRTVTTALMNMNMNMNMNMGMTMTMTTAMPTLMGWVTHTQ